MLRSTLTQSRQLARQFMTFSYCGVPIMSPSFAKKYFDNKYTYKSADCFDYKLESQPNKSLHYIDDFTLRTADLANRIIPKAGS